jgi:hypothetical protein
VMLQLGPKWLRLFGDVYLHEKLIKHVFAQFVVFGIQQPEQYRARLNRIDLTLDVLGLNVASLSIDEWMRGWVGHARKKTFHISPITRELEGLSVGTSEGAVRFKVYDKHLESVHKKTSRFWRSVWGVGEDEVISVARFEWSIQAYKAKFEGLRYLTDFTFLGFLDLLNYASLKWGALCVPNADTNTSRWELAPLWLDVRRMIQEWTFDHEGVASRTYDFRPDINEMYLKSMAGWLGGFMARVGIDQALNNPASIADAIQFLEGEGHPLLSKAQAKWNVFSKLVGGADDDK